MAGENYWGDLIRELRIEQDLSQRQLAHRAKVNRATLRHIEDGTSRGAVDVVEAILGALGYELEALHLDSIRARQEIQEREAADPEFQSKRAMLSILDMKLA